MLQTEFTYKRILLITLPLMIGTFVQAIVTITDAIFVSNLGEIAIGAVGNGSLVYASVFMLARGLADGAQIDIARKNGEGNFTKIGQILWHTQFYQFFMAVAIIATVIPLSPWIIESFSKSAALGEAMNEFVSIRIFGLLFAAQYLVLVAFFVGLGRTRVILFSTVIVAGINVFLDYGLIYGHFGLPKLGLGGAPLASGLSEFAGFLFLWIYLLQSQAFEQYAYRLKQVTFKLKSYLYLFRLSIPLMLQGIASLSTWLVFFIMIEHMGTSNLETAHNIRYMYFLAFVPIFGFAASTKTVISTMVGQGHQNEIGAIQFRIIVLSVMFTLFFFHGALLYPEQLIALVDQNPVISPDVLANSVKILKFVSGSVLIFSVVVVWFNTISGLGKTTISFIIEMAAIAVYLLACYFFIEKWQWSITEVWWVEYVYFISLGIFSLSYLLYYRQKYLKNDQ